MCRSPPSFTGVTGLGSEMLNPSSGKTYGRNCCLEACSHAGEARLTMINAANRLFIMQEHLTSRRSMRTIDRLTDEGQQRCGAKRQKWILIRRSEPGHAAS